MEVLTIKIIRDIKTTYAWQKRSAKNLIRYGTADFFTNLNIEINTSCNKRCRYCPNSVFDRGLLKNERLMDEGLFRKIIDELAGIRFNGRISPHFFGEPLLDKRLVGFMAYARERLPDADIIIFTNGELLTVELYEKLVKSGVSGFLITRHGESMPKNVSKLFRHLQNKPGEKEKIKYHEFNDETPLFNRGGNVAPRVVNPNPRCRSIDNPVPIDVAGNVVLCCNDYHSSVKFGNLNDSSLVEIWNSGKFKRIRERLRKGIFELGICKKCVGIE